MFSCDFLSIHLPIHPEWISITPTKPARTLLICRSLEPHSNNNSWCWFFSCGSWTSQTGWTTGVGVCLHAVGRVGGRLLVHKHQPESGENTTSFTSSAVFAPAALYFWVESAVQESSPSLLPTCTHQQLHAFLRVYCLCVLSVYYFHTQLRSDGTSVYFYLQLQFAWSCKSDWMVLVLTGRFYLVFRHLKKIPFSAATTDTAAVEETLSALRLLLCSSDEQRAERADGLAGPGGLWAGPRHWRHGLQGLGAAQLPGARQLQPPLRAGAVVEEALPEPGQAEGLQQDVGAALRLRHGQSLPVTVGFLIHHGAQKTGRGKEVVFKTSCLVCSRFLDMIPPQKN